MQGTDLSEPSWRKSSFSGPPAKNCVQVAAMGTVSVAVRDSKDPAGPALTFSRADWAAFVQAARAGRVDLDGLPR